MEYPGESGGGGDETLGSVGAGVCPVKFPWDSEPVAETFLSENGGGGGGDMGGVGGKGISSDGACDVGGDGVSGVEGELVASEGISGGGVRAGGAGATYFSGVGDTGGED